jgi:hypothetical protein
MKLMENVRKQQITNLSTLLLPVLLLPFVVFGNGDSQKKIDTSSFFKYMPKENLAKYDLLIFGEKHGHKEMLEVFPTLIDSIHELDFDYNCFFVELDKTSQKAISNILLDPSEALKEGLRDMFNSWQLHEDFDQERGENGIFEKHTLTPELISLLRKKIFE